MGGGWDPIRETQIFQHDVSFGLPAADEHSPLLRWNHRLLNVLDLSSFESAFAGVTDARSAAVGRAQAMSLGKLEDASRRWLPVRCNTRASEDDFDLRAAVDRAT